MILYVMEDSTALTNIVKYFRCVECSLHTSLFFDDVVVFCFVLSCFVFVLFVFVCFVCCFYGQLLVPFGLSVQW